MSDKAPKVLYEVNERMMALHFWKKKFEDLVAWNILKPIACNEIVIQYHELYPLTGPARIIYLPLFSKDPMGHKDYTYE